MRCDRLPLWKQYKSLGKRGGEERRGEERRRRRRGGEEEGRGEEGRGEEGRGGEGRGGERRGGERRGGDAMREGKRKREMGEGEEKVPIVFAGAVEAAGTYRVDRK